MSSSASPSAEENFSGSDNSSITSDQDIDAWDESPRKRRKLSPPPRAAEKSKEGQSDQVSASRIKPKQSNSLSASKTPIAESAGQAESRSEKSTFTELGVHPWLVSSLAALAITKPTPIQKACIPEILKGRDCIGGSRTGSGKTIAFAVPVLQKWAEDPVGIFAVILTPTRELALQIFEQVAAISSPQSLKAVLVTGGADMRAQAIAIAQRPHIVIATPGRLADHIASSGEDTICGLRRARFVVLDEADRLLASGPGSQLPDVETCLSVLPPAQSRQTLLFTATVTPEVRALKAMPRNASKPPPFTITVSSTAPAVPATLSLRYITVPATQRLPFLHALLSTPANAPRTTLIFANRGATATALEHTLRGLGHRATALHSGLRQPERSANLARFRAGAARLLVATDLASRGLDIPAVDLVVNFDVPRDPDDFVHRVGRAARAGRVGEAVTLVGQRDVELVTAIESRVGRKMEAWYEEGVSLEGRVVRGTTLRDVGVAKREALLRIEEGRDVNGKRRRGMESWARS